MARLVGKGGRVPDGPIRLDVEFRAEQRAVDQDADLVDSEVVDREHIDDELPADLCCRQRGLNRNLRRRPVGILRSPQATREREQCEQGRADYFHASILGEQSKVCHLAAVLASRTAVTEKALTVVLGTELDRKSTRLNSS